MYFGKTEMTCEEVDHSSTNVKLPKVEQTASCSCPPPLLRRTRSYQQSWREPVMIGH